MDITEARRVVELEKEGKKILVTLWQNDRISSCVEENESQRCESCEGDAELCQNYIDHLRDQGYEAKEVALGELGAEESLPRFLEQREVQVKATPVIEEE